MKSHLEELLLTQMEQEGLELPVRQLVFAPPRRWHFDFSWAHHMLAVEVEGAIWIGGAHTRGRGFQRDVEKLNRAVMLGWRVLRFTDREIKNGAAVSLISDALAGRVAPIETKAETKARMAQQKQKSKGVTSWEQEIVPIADVAATMQRRQQDRWLVRQVVFVGANTNGEREVLLVSMRSAFYSNQAEAPEPEAPAPMPAKKKARKVKPVNPSQKE